MSESNQEGLVAVWLDKEDARTLADFVDKLHTEDMIDIYGSKAPMRTIVKVQQALLNLRGILVDALRGE